MRTLRQEALDHFLFLSVAHLRRIVATYVRYYNGARPSQAIHRIPAPYPELTMPPPANGQLVALCPSSVVSITITASRRSSQRVPCNCLHASARPVRPSDAEIGVGSGLTFPGTPS
jgi:hypothetical protein